MHADVELEIPLHPVADDFQVQFPHAAAAGLPGFFVDAGPDSRILAPQELPRVVEFLAVGAALRCHCQRDALFGAEAGGSKALIAGVSHFLPGGGAGPDASPPEKVYYVLAGELTVIVGGKETVLRKNDSCYIGPNESREIINRGNDVCTIFVAVAAPPA